MTEKIKQSLQSPSKGLALALLATTQFVLILDIAIVTVALPSIGTDLDFAAADLSWVINAYALTFGGFLLLGGRMSDLIGRRRMFIDRKSTRLNSSHANNSNAVFSLKKTNNNKTLTIKR